MSSAIPRAFSQRGKSQTEIDRENFEKFQSISIQKAINQIECPVKEKHVRTAIIGTFQDGGGGIFSTVADRIPLQVNPIVCWKFCYTLHKILRDGHPCVVTEFQKYNSKLIELGKLWGHLKDNYGKLIKLYTKLLCQKLKFHKKYGNVPGSLKLDDDEFDRFIGRDVDSQFEVSVDMMDYMDDILALQIGVFGSLDMSRSNSMTASGQCRLAPLVQCILESALLYDYIVKILFKLHSNLPSETLVGHRSRFNQQFEALNLFFYSSKNLQYYRNLVQVPSLPDQLPNFLVASELSHHARPMVVLPDVVEDNLVDTTEVAKELSPPVVPDRFDSMARFSDDDKRDKHMHDMKQEIAALKRRMRQMESDDRFELNQCADELRRKDKEIDSIRLHLNQLVIEKNESVRNNEHLEMELKNHLDSVQKQGQAHEEKFKKLKEIYNKLREDHVSLLRLNGDIQKQLKTVKGEVHEKDEELTQLHSQLQLAKGENSMLQQSTQEKGSDTELVAFKSEILNLKQENQDMIAKLQTVSESKEDTQRELTASEDTINELHVSKLNLGTRVQELEEQLCDLQQSLTASVQTHQTEVSEISQREQSNKQNLDQSETRCEKLQKDLEDMVSQLEQKEKKSQHDLEETKRVLVDDLLRLLARTFEEWTVFLNEPSVLSVRSSPEFLIDVVLRCEQKLNELEKGQSREETLYSAVELVQRIGTCVLFTKATATLSPGEHGDRLCLLSSECIKCMSQLLECLSSDDKTTLESAIMDLRRNLEIIRNLADELRPRIKDVKTEEIDELVEHEMVSTTQAIEEAASQFEKLLAQSRSSHSGVQLEVNERIIDSCTQLMQNVRQLIEKSRVLQKEIVATGRGASTVQDYYKKHSRWTEGLLSASKSVAFAANSLLECADSVVSGEGKFEELIVSSQEIAACTTQLMIASQVKSDANSKALQDLKHASKGVSTSTGNVVAQAKSCVEIRDEQVLHDLSHITLTQSKRMEMNSQVRVLELESELNKERVQLAALRKKHYQLGGEGEGWDEDDIRDAEAKTVPK